MLKTKKSKQNVTILVLSVMLAIAAIFGATAAWFISSAGATGTVTTAETVVALKVGSQTYTGASSTNSAVFTKNNIVAKDTIVEEVGFQMTTNTATAGVFVRIKLETSGSLTVGATAADGWTEDGGYYYYGTGKTADTMTAVKGTNYVKFCDAVKLAETSNDQNKTATITVTVETVQAGNQTGDVVWAN